MSLWFQRKDKSGRTHYYSISVPLLFCVALLIGIAVAILLPLLQWLRSCL